MHLNSESHFNEFIKAISFLILIPLLEFASLRFLLHYTLEFYPGFRGMTDYDLIPPVLISVFFVLWVLYQEKPFGSRLQKTSLMLNIISFTTFLVFSYVLSRRDTSPIPSGAYWSWFTLGLLTIASSFFLFLKPSYLLKHSSRYLLIPATFIALSKLISTHVLAFLWEPMGKLTGKISYHVISPFLSEVALKYKIVGSATYTQIINPVFTIAIGSGCSGLEGIFFFLPIWCFFYILKRKEHSAFFWSYTFVLGVFYMYLLNLARIFVFYFISYTALKIFSHDSGIRIFLGLFHNAFAWVLYTLAIWAYYSLCERVAAQPSLIKPTILLTRTE